MKKNIIIFFFIFFAVGIGAQDSSYIAEHYTKHEYQIPMRDGAKLFTAVYTPKDTTQDYPILFLRTPYTVYPYGEKNLNRYLGPSKSFVTDGYIFVYQDVRGKFMSEGEYVNMRPFIPEKKSSTDVDESSDTYDTVDWLIKNLRHHNGKVGMWGISYPGFYAAMGTINAHPNLVAVSPQAPIVNWFVGDDMHHNGALSLLMTFDFFTVFGLPRPAPTTDWGNGFSAPSPDAYNFFLNMGPLKNANEKYFKNTISFWNEVTRHGTYDDFWQSRNTFPHFNKIKPAVLTVGGWYDAEDLYGTFHTYQSIEEKNPEAFNKIVVGPWIHGGWNRTKGNELNAISFGSNTSEYYQDSIEFPFFNYYLKGKSSLALPEASIFITGSNEWRKFDTWPPKNSEVKNLFITQGNKLSFDNSTNNTFDEFVSDPNKPVPYTAKQLDARSFYNREYMIEDQRFAATRPDVLVYQTDVLEDSLTIVGPIGAELYVSTTGTDADWIVKVIDVFPDSAVNPKQNPQQFEMGGFQQLIRGEIMRGKFRNSYEYPEPFKPGEVTKVNLTLQDVAHTFLKGHKIMVQIQSSWFPFFDRNPQKFCDIYNADEKDFQKATHRVFHSVKYPSAIQINLLKEKK
ncbi:MAG: CocE/NonD family hydrolase [Ignavibacteriaceae bacterium]|jgi:hypothetical protein